jgi:hypothetical protein
MGHYKLIAAINNRRQRTRQLMKICIVSDSHDRAELLAAAVAKAKEGGAQAVFIAAT